MTKTTRLEKIENVKKIKVQENYSLELNKIIEKIIEIDKKTNEILPRTKSGRISFKPNDPIKIIYVERKNKINELRKKYYSILDM